MPAIVIEDDKILRALHVILDPDCPAERRAGLQDYLSVDVPDMSGWLAGLRAAAGGAFPARVRMVATQEAMRAALADADALVVEGLAVGADDLAAAPHLRLVQKFGIDTRNIDGAACAARGVRVASFRRGTSVAVAEHVFALLFALARKLCLTNGVIDTAGLAALGFKPKLFDQRHVSGANWARVTGLRTLQGMTMGLIGLGEIGREVAPRAAAFGMEVLYHQRRPLPADVTAPLGVRYAGFDELLARADVVVPLLPLTPETEGLIGRAAFAGMKPGAYLVNVSRAQIVDRAALIAALDSGRLGGAGFDVHYHEPGDADEPLKRYPNVVLTPHIASTPRRPGMDDFATVVASLAAALG